MLSCFGFSRSQPSKHPPQLSPNPQQRFLLSQTRKEVGRRRPKWRLRKDELSYSSTCFGSVCVVKESVELLWRAVTSFVVYVLRVCLCHRCILGATLANNDVDELFKRKLDVQLEYVLRYDDFREKRESNEMIYNYKRRICRCSERIYEM